MTTVKRDVGSEILEGLRELRRGEHGRVINVPDVIRIREGSRYVARFSSPDCWAYRFGRCRIGNKPGAARPAPHERCS